MKDETIDKATFRVNLGILTTLVAVSAAGVFYLSALRYDVQSMSSGLTEVRDSVDRLRDQFSKDSRALAVLETLVRALERRVEVMEKLEKR